MDNEITLNNNFKVYMDRHKDDYTSYNLFILLFDKDHPGINNKQLSFEEYQNLQYKSPAIQKILEIKG